MRPTLEVEIPLCRAMLRVLQCVAAGGRLSSVCTMMLSTLAADRRRGVMLTIDPTGAVLADTRVRD
jgi:hypothetical protein